MKEEKEIPGAVVNRASLTMLRIFFGGIAEEAVPWMFVGRTPEELEQMLGGPSEPEEGTKE